MIRRPPRSTHCISSAASDVYKRQVRYLSTDSGNGNVAELQFYSDNAVTLVSPVSQDDTVTKTKLYSISGYETAKPQIGVNIIKSILANGLSKSEKVLVK
eukprot:TRINITY_DN23806_c0_g1_i2.p4 TRINITY_DN23806_c0_g1~~TRINITY_DN23806_c0_g1_i2.p4  ORF type:complete len:100 (-),score=17.63 TRINITY_DN23806_c0_g1_i2:711-1010(-)